MKNQQKSLWIGGYGPKTSPHGQGLAVFRDRLESATNGEVSVRVTPNIMQEGRSNTDLLDLVESGEMFLCYFSTSYLGERVPPLDVLETPFLFTRLEDAHRALDGPLGDALKQAVRDATGFEVLGFWDNGFRHLTNRHRDVRVPADCRGMTVRLQPNAIHEELIRSWGAHPVSTTLNEGIELIERLAVDAQENPLANTVAYGVDRVHHFVTMTGHLYGARGLFAHRQTYEDMPSDLRTMVGASISSAIAAQRKAAEQLEVTLRAKMEADGVAFVDPTTREKEMFVETSAPAVDLAHELVPKRLFELANV